VVLGRRGPSIRFQNQEKKSQEIVLDKAQFDLLMNSKGDMERMLASSSTEPEWLLLRDDGRRNATYIRVGPFHGRRYWDLRDYYQPEGEGDQGSGYIHTKRGVCLTEEAWRQLLRLEVVIRRDLNALEGNHSVLEVATEEAIAAASPGPSPAPSPSPRVSNPLEDDSQVVGDDDELVICV
jgi:hypothetical protein